MVSIGANSTPKAEIGVATANGRAYYRITSLLKKMHFPYVDIIPRTKVSTELETNNLEDTIQYWSERGIKLVITSGKEKLLLGTNKAISIEDLGDDAAIAKKRLYSILYPSPGKDCLVIGIDPGERSGVVAFMNQREIESSVINSIDDTLHHVIRLLESAPEARGVVKIGSGNPTMANMLAAQLKMRYAKDLRIEFVDERGTSLNSRRTTGIETRDQAAARLIAFREGRNYVWRDSRPESGRTR